jgi:hypothetical protein
MGRNFPMTRAEYEALCRRMKIEPVSEDKFPVKQEKVSKPKMSKTEEEYERLFLCNISHKFEPFTFHMQNGLKYRPDFYIPSERTFIEIKGSYRLHSHGRSMMAFRQCSIEFPEFIWKIATKTKLGVWIIK